MRLPVHIWIREENACPREIAGYFTELARTLDEHPRKMRLVIESSVPVTLDFDPSDGNPVVCSRGETFRFGIRRRWLPEHPVPLEFGKGPVVLFVDPVDGNRFRVRAGRRYSLPWWVYPLAAVSGVVAAVTLHPAAITFTAAVMAVLVVRHVFSSLRRAARARFRSRSGIVV